MPSFPKLASRSRITATIPVRKRPLPPRTRPKADRPTAATDPAGGFENGDYLWGGDAIARYMRISRASFYYLWNSGKLDAAVKRLGHRTLAARKSRLDSLLAGELGA